jgi:hypothetical protein
MLQLHIRRLEDPAESGIVLVLGCTDWQRDMLRAELRRLIPQLGQVMSKELLVTLVTTMKLGIPAPVSLSSLKPSFGLLQISKR